MEIRKRVLVFLQGYLKKQVFQIAKDEKDLAPTFVLHILLFFQDVANGKQPYFYFDQPEMVDKFRKTFTSGQIISIINIIKEKDKLMHRNTNPQLIWDSLQVGLMEVFNG